MLRTVSGRQIVQYAKAVDKPAMHERSRFDLLSKAAVTASLAGLAAYCLFELLRILK